MDTVTPGYIGNNIHRIHQGSTHTNILIDADIDINTYHQHLSAEIHSWCQHYHLVKKYVLIINTATTGWRYSSSRHHHHILKNFAPHNEKKYIKDLYSCDCHYDEIHVPSLITTTIWWRTHSNWHHICQSLPVHYRRKVFSDIAHLIPDVSVFLVPENAKV